MRGKPVNTLRKYMDYLGRILETVMAVVVIAASLAAIAGLRIPFRELVMSGAESRLFMDFLDRVLDIIIGIELFKMLLKPGAATVLEVMMFCIARHMIVHDTTAWENLLTIIGVGLILAIRKFFLAPRESSPTQDPVHTEGDAGPRV